jgi:hypothetical protein
LEPSAPTRSISPAVRPSVQPRVVTTAKSPAGSAIVGAEICLSESERITFPACDRSAADGTARFEVSNAKAYSVSVVAPGYVLKTHHTTLEDFDHSGEARALLILQPGGVALTGTVADATGGPVPGAIVLIGSPFSEELSVGATVDAAGRFVVSVPTGSVHLVVHADGYSRISLDVSAPAENVKVVLGPEAAIHGWIEEDKTQQRVGGVDVTVTRVGGLGHRSVWRERKTKAFPAMTMGDHT